MIQGHRATYEHRFFDSMSKIKDRWVYFNNTVHSAWKNAQINGFTRSLISWLQPTSAAADYYYITELWQDVMMHQRHQEWVVCVGYRRNPQY